MTNYKIHRGEFKGFRMTSREADIWEKLNREEKLQVYNQEKSFFDFQQQYGY